MDKGEEKLVDFFNTCILNDLKPIFTMEWDKNKSAFIDVVVIKKECKIITDVFYTITDTKQYLLFDSCHPKHTRNNIPYDLARRLCTIISDAEILDIQLITLAETLSK
jgi:hypothetical protein